jgi:hypothetical protein
MPEPKERLKSWDLYLHSTIPGVKKEDIQLRVKDDSFQLVASRDDFDYVTASAFCCPVNAKSAKARYEDAYNVTIVYNRYQKNRCHDTINNQGGLAVKAALFFV